jgi:hypothetical protein
VNLHLVEIWNFRGVDQVDYSEILDFLSDGVEGFVHLHTSWVPIVTEANYLE